MPMRFDLITLFPELFNAVTEMGVTGRAHKKGIWSLKTWNPRNYTHNIHHTVDDRPYGGGPGMVMLAQPLLDALSALQDDQASQQLKTPVVLLSPAGQVFNQAMAQRWANSEGVTLLCGRYEGIDQRFIDHYVDEEVSLGDFVLSGGELAALPIVDACVRLLPKVLNTKQSALQDSFHPELSGLLDSPHYTRPEVFEGKAVPEVLLSGHHQNIARWRRQQSLRLSFLKRPDLIETARQQQQLTKEDEHYLASLSKALKK